MDVPSREFVVAGSFEELKAKGRLVLHRPARRRAAYRRRERLEHISALFRDCLSNSEEFDTKSGQIKQITTPDCMGRKAFQSASKCAAQSVLLSIDFGTRGSGFGI